MKFEWKGVMPALTTKFTAQDTLDEQAFRHNVKAQLDAGVHGLILGGTLGAWKVRRMTEGQVQGIR